MILDHCGKMKQANVDPLNKGWSNFFSFLVVFFRPTSDVNISETGYPIYLKINVRRVASGDSLHFNF